MTVTKGRDWSAIIYPDSAPDNWRSILDDTHLKWIESPLHDQDVYKNGKFKKPHWHILIIFDGPVTVKPVKDITEELNAPIPQKVNSSKGLVRYMAHIDNPEKHQYSITEIIGHGGSDIKSYFELSKTNKLEKLKEMIQYIYDNDIDNYSDFLMICIKKSDDWFNLAINSNTYSINKMIDGVWQRGNKFSSESR